MSSNAIGMLANGEVILSTDLPENKKSSLLNVNYPNPFSRFSTIVYRVEHAGSVRLEVFDLSGKRVALLVDGFKNCWQV